MLVRRLRLDDAAEEGLVHLVALAGDDRADRGGDPLAAGAPFFHSGDRGFDHSGEGALPAGMGGADHAGLAVGEQHRRAVRGEDGEGETRTVRHHRIGMGPPIVGPGLLDIERVRGMDLEQGDEARARHHRVERPPPVLLDQTGIVARAEADVEARADPGRDAAATAEKAVRNALQRGGADDLDGHRPRLITGS